MSTHEHSRQKAMSWLKLDSDRNPVGGYSRHCSLCGQPFDSQRNDFTPFCSQRCQQLDLSNWLDERYGLPYEGEEDKPLKSEEEQLEDD